MSDLDKDVLTPGCTGVCSEDEAVQKNPRKEDC